MGDFYPGFSQHAAGGVSPQQPMSSPQPGQQMDWFEGGGASSFAAPDYNFSGPPLQSGARQAAAGFGDTDSFQDEPPLLEELGIDIPGILRRSRGILLNRSRSTDVEELDLGGPLIFCLLLGSVHLLAGKLHFGVILGWSCVASIAIWFVVNSMVGMDNPETKQLLDLYSCCCLLGYCMLPMVLFALLALLLPRGPTASTGAGLTTLWCGATAGKLFSKRSPSLEEHKWLVAYPCMLIYAAFALLTVC